jgi:hypothetical protein
MQIHRDSRGYPSYFCPNARSRGCPTGWHSTLRSDPQLDEQLEMLLGDLETLTRLIDASAEEAARRAQAPPSELARRLTDLENQRRRVKDAYVEGASTWIRPYPNASGAASRAESASARHRSVSSARLKL